MDTNYNSEMPAAQTTRRRLLAGAIGALGSVALISRSANATTAEGISHAADAIHQEPVFAASAARLYEALTDGKQFTEIVRLSGVLQAMKLPDTPAQISTEVGGAFGLFGGYITGRQLELVPATRIVQAWRAASWPPGAFSIASFVFREQGAMTTILFDHGGFPKGTADSLASGWISHYWEPLAKLVA